MHCPMKAIFCRGTLEVTKIRRYVCSRLKMFYALDNAKNAMLLVSTVTKATTRTTNCLTFSVRWKLFDQYWLVN